MKKNLEIEEYYCDVCGKKADGSFRFASYANGEVNYEFSIDNSNSLDLCKKHADYLSAFFDKLVGEYFPDRYDTKISKNKKEELINYLKKIDE